MWPCFVCGFVDFDIVVLISWRNGFCFAIQGFHGDVIINCGPVIRACDVQTARFQLNISNYVIFCHDLLLDKTRSVQLRADWQCTSTLTRTDLLSDTKWNMFCLIWQTSKNPVPYVTLALVDWYQCSVCHMLKETFDNCCSNLFTGHVYLQP